MKYSVILGIIVVVIGLFIYFNQTEKTAPQNPTTSVSSKSMSENDPPQIVSTKPSPLEEAIVSANETIEITFNRSLENVGEFKLRIEPKVEYKLEFSQDRKTAKIIPSRPYELGSTYTLFIGPDTKFEGIGEWRQEKLFHFKTIRYRGV